MTRNNRTANGCGQRLKWPIVAVACLLAAPHMSDEFIEHWRRLWDRSFCPSLCVCVAKYYI